MLIILPRDRVALTLIEGTVLGLLVEEPRHGFALARELTVDGWIGTTFTAHRPVVYRALRSLSTKGLLAEGHTESTSSGPERVVEAPNAEGKEHFGSWVGTPVPHMRDMRVDFLVKLAFHDRLGLNPSTLVREQYAVLEPIYQSLQQAFAEAAEFEQTVAMWRAENSESVMRFLSRLMTSR